jgi:hypothetical protein
MSVPKSSVARIVAVEETGSGSTATAGSRREITQADIDAILGSDHVDIGSVDRIEQVDLSQPLETDMDSVRQMLRIGGTKARYMDTFPHFVLVYTSDREKAQALGARLESVYQWNVKYMKMLDIPRIRMPKAKLEIFFFGTHEEYTAYQTLNGWRNMGAIGFYMRTNNRSAFFDMMTYPPYKQQLDRVKDKSVPAAERQRVRSRIEHEVAHENLEVVQHEAAHHIHFNLGIFPAQGDVPRWMTEGLATMFEVPPSDAGASFGAINHFRVYHFRNAFGDRGQNLPDMRQFILNDGVFQQLGFHGYSIGWALNHYLFREHNEAYAKWMQLLAKRDDDWSLRLETAEKQEQFEEIFGEIDDEWVKNFNDYIASIQLRRSVLPPSIRDNNP